MNLRSVAKSLDDSAFNLRLAVFAAIVFPATFVAAMFGMSDGFKPGDGEFWVFWVTSVPLILMMVVVVLGRGFSIKGVIEWFGAGMGHEGHVRMGVLSGSFGTEKR